MVSVLPTAVVAVARRGETVAKRRPLLPKRAAVERERMDRRRKERVNMVEVLMLVGKFLLIRSDLL